MDITISIGTAPGKPPLVIAPRTGLTATPPTATRI
jgi:hypothetical protein